MGVPREGVCTFEVHWNKVSFIQTCVIVLKLCMQFINLIIMTFVIEGHYMPYTLSGATLTII